MTAGNSRALVVKAERVGDTIRVTLNDERTFTTRTMPLVHHQDQVPYFETPWGLIPDRRPTKQRLAFQASEHTLFCEREEKATEARHKARAKVAEAESEFNRPTVRPITAPTAPASSGTVTGSSVMRKNLTNVRLAPEVPAAGGTATAEKPKAAKKSAKAKPAAKASKKAAKEQAAPKGDLTGNEVKILKAMSHTNPNHTVSRADLVKKTEIEKGWSRTLGAASKGKVSADSMEGRGLIKSVEAPEGERGFRYHITAKGKAVLAKAK